MPTVYFIFLRSGSRRSVHIPARISGLVRSFFLLPVAIMPVFILLAVTARDAALENEPQHTLHRGMRQRRSALHQHSDGAAAARQADRIFADQERIYRRGTTRQRLRWNNLSGGTLYIPVSGSDCGKFVCEISNFRCCDLLRLVSIRRKAPAPVSCVIMPSAAAPDGLRDISAELEARTVLKAQARRRIRRGARAARVPTPATW